MIKTMDRRLLVPATMAIGGSAIAIATWIGQGFGNALGIEIFTVVATVGYFVLGGRDSDFGATFGSRPTSDKPTSIYEQLPSPDWSWFFWPSAESS